MQTRSNGDWARAELGSVDLGDPRRTARLIKLCGRLSEMPESSINQACGDWAETKAAYRFFHNENVEVRKILAAHQAKTFARARQHRTVLAIQDTSYLVYTSHRQTTGLGKLSLKKGKRVKKIHSQGLLMHSCLAVTTDGVPLGLLDQKIFALQDEIVQKIVTTLKLQLTLEEQGVLVRKTTDNLEAYDYFLRGLESYNRATQEANAQARQMFEKAIELDPQYAEAYAGLSWTHSREWVYQWSQDPQALERAFVLAQKAVTLDDSLPGAYTALCYVYLYKRQHEQAIAAAERGIALAPNDAEGSRLLGLILNFAGRPEDAIGLIKKVMRLNPRYPYNYLAILGMAYRLAGRYEDAIATLKTATIRNPDHLPLHLHLAVGYSELGRDAEARAEVAELLRLSPNFSLEGVRRVMPFKNQAESERYLAALRKAGLK